MLTFSILGFLIGSPLIGYFMGKKKHSKKWGILSGLASAFLFFILVGISTPSNTLPKNASPQPSQQQLTFTNDEIYNMWIRAANVPKWWNFNQLQNESDFADYGKTEAKMWKELRDKRYYQDPEYKSMVESGVEYYTKLSENSYKPNLKTTIKPYAKDFLNKASIVEQKYHAKAIENGWISNEKVDTSVFGNKKPILSLEEALQ